MSPPSCCAVGLEAVMYADWGEPSEPAVGRALAGINGTSGADGSVLGGGHSTDEACGGDGNTGNIIAQAALGGNQEGPLAEDEGEGSCGDVVMVR